MKRADIKTNFSCNNHCLFCVQGKKREEIRDKSFTEIQAEMKQAIKDCQSIVLTGGEPTARPDFLDEVRFAKKLGFQKIQIQSNGRMFAYMDFCKETIKAGANEFSPALHGHVPALHDYLTDAKGSFDQTTKGIQNLKKLEQKIVTNTVITKSNYRNLPDIASLLVSFGVDQFQFAFVHAMGSAFLNFESIVPRMTLVEPYVKRGLDIGIKHNKIVMTEAIPYCFMSGYEDYVAEKVIPETKIYDYRKVIEDFTKARQTEGKSKGPRCKECRYDDICEGPWREYPEKLSWGEFIPVARDNETDSNFQRAIDESFDLLIKENKLTKKREIIQNIKKIIFDGFDERWLRENQKFDISLSSKKRGIRFSYNNFHEKEDFEKKLTDIFSLLGGVYSKQQLKSLLKLMMFDGNKHQTTFGIEWLAKKELPRIKIYFEELFNVYSNKIILKKLKEICGVLKVDFDRLNVNDKEKVGAICVDFMPTQSINLKVYFLHTKIDDKNLENFVGSEKPSKNSKLFRHFLKCLSSEKKAFFYTTKRFGENSLIASYKFYKIYEVNGISDHFKKAWAEIGKYWNLANESDMPKQMKMFEKICGKYKLDLYPVIIALDSTGKEENADLYFSFR